MPAPLTTTLLACAAVWLGLDLAAGALVCAGLGLGNQIAVEIAAIAAQPKEPTDVG